MRKIICMVTLCLGFAVQANAQDWKEILSGVAKTVVGDKTTTATSIVGTWNYVGPDCQLKGDNVLTNIGGDTASGEVEKKMEGIYKKAGLNTIQYTFNEDKTCTIKAGKLNLKTTAHIVTLGSNMSFLFDADKVLSVVKTITGAASKLNSSASTINALASKFDGMMIGFELKKQ